MDRIGSVSLTNNADGKQHIVEVYGKEAKPNEVPRLHPEWPEEFFAVTSSEEGGLITARIFKFGQQVRVGIAILKKNEKGQLEVA